ncbi:hypothetical protein MHZ92_14405 [Sporosarcina sp. ACRSL]|uniref:hypothetical protein n=1 Tax=Sporosarcina sp. ACRSL TaxID=2918215 RepID=UPI001EF3FE92|nr:hypothetical protein [Sporosarcina sp. ACRSL]MCG7345328.1 hypothetical protein [Sporosarcina sp. ACRSL]
MKPVKHDLNAFTPEELRSTYIEKYAETFESTKEHALEMFLSEYNADHDFHTLANVEYAIEEMIRICA